LKHNEATHEAIALRFQATTIAIHTAYNITQSANEIGQYLVSSPLLVYMEE